MATEEDTELRDLLAQTLEINGCMPKIRAQLRASIFLALHEDQEVQEVQPLLNKKVKDVLESPDGRLVFCLIREFLEYFDLDFTMSVYEPETYLGHAYQYKGRTHLIEDLGISQLDATLPLLLQIVQIARLKSSSSRNIDINLTKIGVDESESLNKLSNEAQPQDEKSFSEHESQVNGVEVNLNKTFDVSTPVNEKVKSINIHLTQLENDDSETSVPEDTKESHTDSSKSSAHTDEKEDSLPVLNRSKLDKLSPPKNDKLKAKSSLSSLADLPPLQLNKSRETILPSPYSKKEKNLKELEKFFDLDNESIDNYEEDFISESDINLSPSLRDNTDSNKTTPRQVATDTDSNQTKTEDETSTIGEKLESGSVRSSDILNSPTPS